MRFQDRQHYVRVAACAMRQVLVVYARRRSAQKRDSAPMIHLDRPGNVTWFLVFSSTC
jgi:hypothetical protein